MIKFRGHLLDNAWVVPYNPYLLAKFDCYINIEICSTIKAIKYLYKYIYKGHDKVAFNVVEEHGNEEIDEIAQYQSAGWISPPEAMWQIYRFVLNETHPSVISLQLHLDGCQMVSFTNTSSLKSLINSDFCSRTMLTEFFVMNRTNNKAKDGQLLYEEFLETFVWVPTDRIWYERK